MASIALGCLLELQLLVLGSCLKQMPLIYGPPTHKSTQNVARKMNN